jgi:hypothetical protein
MLLTSQLANVATPERAANGLVVQVNVPLLGLSLIEAELLVTVLPLVSSTVTTGCVVQAVPPVPPPGCVVKANLAAAPGLTVNAVLVPVLAEAVAVIVNEPVLVILTLCGSSTPDVNAPEGTGLPVNAPLEVSDAVDVKDVTVLLFTSCAVMRRMNAVPAVCVPIVPPPDCSTLK